MEFLKKMIRKFHKLFEYLFYSVLSTILDVAIVWALYNKAGLNRSLITSCPEWFAFLVSKGVSVVVPFFAMYFARKVLYAQLRRKEGQKPHE